MNPRVLGNFSKMFAEPFFGSCEMVKTASKSTGLRYWMLRVLEECDNVATDFRAESRQEIVSESRLSS